VISIKKVLVPTDFSPPSEIAIRYGKAFAQSFNAALHVLHVVEEAVLDYYSWTAPASSPVLLGVREEMERSARDQLASILSDDERTAFRGTLVSIIGSPFVEIVRYAKAEDIDLIVIGTHGRGPIAHMLMGSVAEKVVRKAPCPVLTVRPEEHEFVMP
jgi:nucleotide-binding universal stress UspA family protein